MSDKLLNWVMRIGGLLLIAFVFFQVFRNSFETVETETVIKTTVIEYVDANAMAIRSESLVCSDISGVAVYSAANGEKVAKGSTLIEYYNNQSDVAKKKKIDELEEQIRTLTELDEQNSYTVGDLDVISSQISSGLYAVLDACEAPDKRKLNDAGKTLLKAMNQGQIATGREKDYKSVIGKLEAKLDKLKSSYNGSIGSFVSEESGYFVNSADGYESSFTYDNVLDMTYADIENVNATALPNNCVGKLINSDEWYFVAQFDASDSRNIVAGKSVTVKIPYSDIGEFKMYVEKVTENLDGTATAILSCSYMSSELSTLRSQKIQIVAGKHTGLRVNSKAVRVVDNETGVYVKIGKLIKFRKVDIIYNDEDFVICESSQNAGQLKIYDEAVIKGKGLRHEKLLY